MVRSRIPTRNEKRYKTVMREARATVALPRSAANAAKLDKLFIKKEKIIKKERRQKMEVEYDKDLLNSKAAKVTLRNIKKVEGRRMRRLQRDLPMILQRGANLHNENNLAFVNKILSNLI